MTFEQRITSSLAVAAGLFCTGHISCQYTLLCVWCAAVMLCVTSSYVICHIILCHMSHHLMCVVCCCYVM